MVENYLQILFNLANLCENALELTQWNSSSSLRIDISFLKHHI